MASQVEHEGSKHRVIQYRARVSAQGLRRVEVTVPANDARLVKEVASVLRAGGDEAGMVREAFAAMTAIEPVRTGAELVAFLRASPLVGQDLAIERDQMMDRTADLR